MIRSPASNLRRIGQWQLNQRVYSVRHGLLGTIIELHGARGKGRQDPDTARAYALVRLARPMTGPPVKVGLEDLRTLKQLQKRLERLKAGRCPECDIDLDSGYCPNADACGFEPPPLEGGDTSPAA